MSALLPVVVDASAQPFDVSIRRPSKWGNPYHRYARDPAFRVESAEDAVRAYDAWIRDQPQLLEALPELFGKRLGCCKAPPCHGYVLIQLIAGMR